MSVFLLFFVVDIVLVYIPLFYEWNPFHFNWVGKGLEFLWALFFVYGLKFISPREAAFVKPTLKMLLWGAILGVLLSCYQIIRSYASQSFVEPRSIEYFLYQATMPGLAEEFVYRGVLLGIFNRNLNRPLGAIFTTVLFVLVHIISYHFKTNEFVWMLNIEAILFLSVFSLLLVFLRERTKSVWPCVVAHNIVNTLPSLF